MSAWRMYSKGKPTYHPRTIQINLKLLATYNAERDQRNLRVNTQTDRLDAQRRSRTYRASTRMLNGKL